MEDAVTKPIDLTSLENNGTIARQRNKENERWWEDARLAAQDRLTLDLTHLFEAPGDPHPMTRADLDAMAEEAQAAHRDLLAGRGDVKDGEVTMLGWQDLPDRITGEHLDHIQQVVSELSGRIDAYVSLGIGGSYLGIEATIKALTHTHFNSLSRDERGGAPELYFLGQNMDPDFFRDTLDRLRDKRVGVNVISKSGTTTETAIAFRILRRLLEQTHGAGARELILATTDARKGALRTLAEELGLRSFVVPDDIGGRFSVLSDVGLVGIAMAGIDIREFVAGFAAMKRRTDGEELWENPAMVHAAVRTLAFRKGKKLEVVATNSAALSHVARYMEQLFPESEGHGGKGLWVSPSMYSEKLHANGQMVQQGERNILETFLRLGRHDSTVPVPHDPQNLDGLNYLPEAGRDMAFINGLVVDGPSYAHFQGGVPNMTVNVPRRNAHCLGQLYYMMERSVAISGTMLGHNPFIQPGVVDYKKAIFALAGKPGHEQEAERMKQEMASRERVLIE